MRAFKLERPEAVAEAPQGDHGRLDAVRSWLASGHHIFRVDPRRRRGHHGHARQLLADDLRPGEGPGGDWQALASALDRHTIRGGMTELGAEERRVVTLAYLEGRSNREIAAILGVSVSTVRRRLWVALKQLDAYVSRTGSWLSAIILLGAGHLIARAHKLERIANTDWAQKAVSTVAVGAVAAAAIALTAAMPDSAGSTGSSTQGPAPLIAAAPGGADSPAYAAPADLQPPQTSTTDTSTSTGPLLELAPGPGAETLPSSSSKQGCGGNPTSAPPPVPVKRHHGSPVTHPSKGGCRV